MTRQIIDLTGQRFGLWTVVSLMPERRGNKLLWFCRCDCGTEKVITGDSLRMGDTHSCGCNSRKACSDKLRKHGNVRCGKIPEYRIWQSMKARCKYENRECYKDYGGRGISVCERWDRSYEAFIADMGPMPQTGDRFTIERKDTNGDYEPSNCVWATYKEQARNKRDNRLLTFRGETKPLIVWAEEVGISYKVIGCRLNRYGWSVERALTTPPREISRASSNV